MEKASVRSLPEPFLPLLLRKPSATNRVESTGHIVPGDDEGNQARRRNVKEGVTSDCSGPLPLIAHHNTIVRPSDRFHVGQAASSSGN